MSKMDSSNAGTQSVPSGAVSTTGSQTKMGKYRQKAKKSVASFFGLVEDDVKNNQRWEHRRVRIASQMGKGVRDEYVTAPPMDMMDAPNIIDPLRTSRQASRMSTMTATSAAGQARRKKSVLQMTMNGISQLSSARKDLRKKSFKGQSFPPGSIHSTEERPHPGDDFSLVDDVFYDEHPASSEGGGRSMDLAGGPSAPGWRRRPPQALPSTPGVDLPDGPDFGLKRIKQKVVDSVMNRDKRTVGMGIVGRLMRRRLKSNIMTKDVRKQLDNLDDHRPYFTYWVTFVQVVVFIVAIAVYGIAPIGISTTEESANVKMPNLAIQTETHVERDNLWIGPRQRDLIHLGAKYSPCMRVDENLNTALSYDRHAERGSACCIRNDGGGCRQTVKSDCNDILSRWEKWTPSNPGPNGRLSGTVCGQDPRYCNKPSSSPPFEWPDEITQWPICEDTAKPNQSLASTTNEHMTCDILGRPCCFGIQGECIITTREHCDLKRGFFHDEANLCSQVDCFEEICGMIPFANPEKPDQFYRLWTSLFLHGGLVHVAITVLFQMYIMRDMEKLMGAIRVSIIYLGSGIAGNLASCTFIPYQVEKGPSGSQFGIVACLLVEVIQNRKMYRSPALALVKLIVPLLFFFLLGLLPWFDNWAHMFGFLFGFLLAFALMPYVSFGKFNITRRVVTILVSLGMAVGLFTLLIILFYLSLLSECDWCVYLNCIPFTADFCENMEVKLKTNSTYSAFI
ncbi:inactive rhomboid protein 1 [Aplysia californica]|uniref:Inactive rhomboid protein 1 n=1 Tax=Aplysia californica TaxID=6500 RepID=A0ABM1VVZ6_APLCA|nr:inactive rhomboid protein 1 [Aplysia californica]XP_035826588.1 inactive rhomboid protein 1 [Aplysia californica]